MEDNPYLLTYMEAFIISHKLDEKMDINDIASIFSITVDEVNEHLRTALLKILNGAGSRKVYPDKWVQL